MMTKTLLKYLLPITLPALFATAFMVENELVNGVWTAKTFYFYGVSVITFSLALLNLLVKKDSLKIKFNILDFTLILFYLYNVIRLIFTEEVPTYNARIITFSFLLILYLIFKKYFNLNKITSAFFIIVAFLLSGLFQASIGLFQAHNLFGYNSGFFLAFGTFGNPAPYTGFIISILPFALGLYLFLEAKNIPTIILKYLGLVTFCATIFVLPVTKTRGGWLAAIGGISVVLFYKYDLGNKIGTLLNKPYKKGLTSVLLLSVAVVSIVGLYQLRPASAYGRLLIWKVSITKIIAENPIFGIGYDRFGQVYNNYQGNYFAEKDRNEFEKFVAGNVKQAHNEYIETTAELGAIGLFLFVGVLATAIFSGFYILSNSNFKALNSNFRNLSSNFYKPAKASVIALMISGFFSYPFQILPTLLNFILLLSIISSFGHYNIVYSVKIKNSQLKFLSIITLPLLFFFSITQIEKYNNLIKWNEAVALSHYQSYDKAINIYKDLYPKLNTSGNFLVNYGGVLALNKQYKEATKILEEGIKINSDPNLFISLGNSYKGIGKYEEAENNYKIASNIIPHKYYPRYLLAKLYNETNRSEEAKILAQQIIAMNEKISSSAIYQIKNEMKEIINYQIR